MVLCLAVLVGIGLARRGVTAPADWWWLGLFGVLCTIKRLRGWTLVWMVVLGLGLGVMRGNVYVAHAATYQSYFGHKITITGRASKDASNDKNKQFSFDATDLNVASTGQKLVGKVDISGFGVPALYAGDTFTAEGKLQPGRGSYQMRMSYAQLHVVAVDHGLINSLRRGFGAGLESALPEPLGSFAMGLLIGQKVNLPDEIYQQLLMVGLVHIIAVSGYNLTIILRATNRAVGARSKRLSTLLGLALIVIFLLFAGASASIVRAAVVSSLALAAAYYGRNVKPLLLILLAAMLTGWWNPYYVWSDLGWYLSFLAFCGVMILAPMLLARMPRRLQGSLIFAMALETFCAELVATPYIIHVFGQTSLVGIVANVLVAALVPLAMLLSLLAGLAGMLVPVLAGWIAWPAKLVLTYMLDTAKLLSDIPHVFVENMVLGLFELLAIYVVIGLFAWSVWQRLGRPQFVNLENQLEHRPNRDEML
jgi:competence protein ComEC